MAGTFSKANRPDRPGAYFNFQAIEAQPNLGSTQGIVAIPFTADWGPTEQVVTLNSFGDYLKVFGSPVSATFSEGYRSVYDAFRGEGFGLRAGAGQVLAFRMVGAAGAKASRAIDSKITITAKYDGTVGNRLKTQVVAHSDVSKHILLILDGSVEIERYTYAKTDITALAALVNAQSNWVTAGTVTSGTAIAVDGSPVALSAGNDGTTLLAADYTAFEAAIEPYRFSLLALMLPASASSILTSAVTWAKGLNSGGKRFVTVIGGDAGESVSTAITRSGTINDPNFVNLGGGTYTDAKFGDLGTYQLAPRVAGILAAAGESQAITFKRLAGLTIKVGSTESEILAGLAGGVVNIARDSHPEAPTRLEKGLTTYTDTTDTSRPLNIYSNPKFVRTMHGLEIELTEFAENNVIGRLPVNDSTREYLIGAMASRLAAREEAGVVQPKWTVDVDQDPPPTEEDEFVALVYSIGFGRSLEQVFNTVVVG